MFLTLEGLSRNGKEKELPDSSVTKPVNNLD
jgi:hypothetical protein